MEKKIELNSSEPLCSNVYCCLDMYCKLAHIKGHIAKNIRKITICRYSRNCSDTLCQYYHPEGKHKGNCDKWESCLNVYCQYAHAHKLRPPVCNRSFWCTNIACRRLHPATNEKVHDTSMWKLFTTLYYLVEPFLTFSECRYLSMTCGSINSVLSTNSRRVLSFYKKKPNNFVKLTSRELLKRWGINEVVVHEKDIKSTTKVYKSVVYIYSEVENIIYQRLTQTHVSESLHTLLSNVYPRNECYKQPEWFLVANTDLTHHVVVCTNQEMDNSWQTYQYLKYCGQLDICHVDGIWYTCEIIKVTENEVTYKLPRWCDNLIILDQPSPIYYPSPYISHPGCKAYRWKEHIRVGSQLRIFEQTGIFFQVTVHVIVDGLLLVSDGFIDIEISDELNDNDGLHYIYAPNVHEYKLKSQFTVQDIKFKPSYNFCTKLIFGLNHAAIYNKPIVESVDKSYIYDYVDSSSGTIKSRSSSSSLSSSSDSYSSPLSI